MTSGGWSVWINQVYGYCFPTTEREYECLAVKGKQKLFCKIEGLSEWNIFKEVRQ
ncbi:unnamed protein product [Fusarium graminearum]|uniref:Chromosome 2, complete genome n=1 Tax=Gibberella zeae (strain ATCC MYA-4620 / CBS 123657 / FGSC 9075 / NRRL 31084 / PH-1) TaxID=229533 RepID=A0A0E0S8I9_GIBZE|nr:hypothetical protein FG05_35065 [Fusarium graminearum]CEF79814.1 unnamed protein product [Fusarium graminearum]CZS83122.1 unnamed protein product [Fusarium graminearum]